MPTEITVRGSYSAFHAPERGTVHASIAYEGPAMEPVYERVARDLEAVKASIVPLKAATTAPSHGGPLTNCAPGRIGPGIRTASSFRSCTTRASVSK